MRLAVATLFAFLAFASPALASQVSIQSVDIGTPSAAAGARTVYRVALTTTAGPLSGTDVLRVTLPAGTGTVNWQGGTMRNVTRGVDVGSCSTPTTGVSTCGLFSSQTIFAGDQVLVTLRGLTNSAAGSKTLQVNTTDDVDPRTSPSFSVVGGNQVSTPTVTIADPSAAAGARTQYVTTFTVSGTGGLSAEGGSQITVTLPAGTATESWQGGTVRDLTRNVDVGSCGSPSAGLTSTCGFFSSQFVNAGDQLQITLRGVTNGSAGNKTLQVSTTSDTPAITSSPFTIVAANSVTQPAVTIGTPSAAAGARTSYVTTFNISGTGGLSADAGSQITVTLPAGTTAPDWQGGTVRDITRDVDVGACSAPGSGLVATCGFFSSQFAAAGDQLRITLRGITNGSAGTDKTVAIRTTSDRTDVTSSAFSIIAGNQITQPSVIINSPSAGAGARTRYAIGFTVSSTGGLSSEAGSQLTVNLPAGTTAPSWQGGTVHVDGRNVDVGNCSNPGTTLVSTCGLFSSAVVLPGETLTITLRGITNGAAGAGKTAQVSTTSDLPARTSTPFDIVNGAAVTQPAVAIADPSPATGARTRYVITFNVSGATGGMSSDAGSQITVNLPAGTTAPEFRGALVEVVNRGDADVGNCSNPGSTRVSTCGLFSGAFVNSGDTLRITLRGVTNAGTGSKTLDVTTTSDLPTVVSSAFNVVAGNALTGLSVRVGATAPLARTPYVVEMATSATGGLSSEAGSAITLTFPDGTGFTEFNSGAILDIDRGVNVGTCGSRTGMVVSCAFFSSAFVNAGDRLRISFPGITNPPTAGPYTLTASTTSDIAPVDSGPYTDDTVAPETTIISGPTGSVSSTNATFTFSSTEAGSTFQCALDSAAFGACPLGYTGLSQGSHTFQVRATDPAGHTDDSPASRTWTVDTIAPDTSILTGPSGSVSSTSATFTFNSTEAGSTFQCSFDGAAFGPCPAGYTGLSQGSHTFQVRATDAAGNTDASPASRTWTVDTIAPDTTITAGPTGSVSSTSATFTFGSTDAGSTFQCSLDGAAFGTCAAGYTGLSQGSHTFQVRATDAAGNLDASPASRTWTVDTVAPDTNITAGPTGAVASTSATFTFTATEAGSTFQCSFDGAAFGACPAGYTGLSQGSHTFQVRATDAAGNTDASPASRTWTVDTVAPDTSITAGPTGTVSSTSATFTFTATEAGSTFQCALDGATFGACPAGYTGLSQGSHTFQVRATDAAGNTDGSPASRTWTVDTVPDTNITAGPTGTVSSTSAAFTFTSTEAGSTFQCSFDGAAFGACPAGYTGLSQGPHTFQVRAIDAAGNTDASPASRTWTVDTVQPNTTITAGANTPGSVPTPTFSFTSNESGATFQCRVDAAAFATCTSPHTTAALAPGSHTFEVRAVDAAGNVGATATRAFMVVPPTPTATPIPTVAPTPTPTPTPVPPPQFNQSVVVKPVSGTVLVCLRGEPCRPLQTGERIPIGATVDARKGVVELASVSAPGAPPQSARFSGGIFRVNQRGGVTELTLTEPLAPCGKNGRSAAKKPKSRRLWGHGSGKFRTAGQYSSATVRGTRWLVQDSCAGTLTRVTEGVVSVRDNVRRKTVTVRKGASYLAKPRR